jgi:hypothetical protein
MGESDLECDRGKDIFDCEGSVSLRGEFLGRESGDEVLCREPNFLTNFPGFKLLSIRSGGHALHCKIVTCNGFFSSLLEISDSIFCRRDS